MGKSRTESGAWAAARRLAERTPDSRNRYVDFLRAVSISAVISGHWLIAAPYLVDGRWELGHMLGLAPWTQWLTFGFQVMPVFFMVGGYSNAASWDAARRAEKSYGSWLHARLLRLVGPVMPLLLLWGVLALLAGGLDLDAERFRLASQAALVPVWFLAVYVLVVLLVPWTRAAWLRWGMASFWAPAFLAVAADAARFVGGAVWVAWGNYLFVWLAVHQLGYVWRDGRIGGLRQSWPWFAGGVASLSLLIVGFGYPHSMVGVPGEAVSNTLPPSLAMLALGATQVGLVLTFEHRARAALARSVPWTATVLVNGMIMTVYLWHLTVMIVAVALLAAVGGYGLDLVPGSSTWWASRPLWIAFLVAALLPFVALFGRFEHPGPVDDARVPAAWRSILGTLLVCFGLALLALAGIRPWVVALPFAGAALAGILIRPHRTT